jgi:hypothetical protein
MKRFTKLFMTLALLCVAGSVSAQETDGCATFANPGKTNAEWVPSSSSFKWGAASWNQVHNIGLLANETDPNSDISNLKTLTINYEILSGNGFRVLFYQGGSNIALYINASGAYRDNGFSNQVAATVDGVVEIPIYDFLSNADGYSTDYMFKLSDICLSGFGGSGEVKIYEMCVSTYGPDDEKPQIIADEEEQDPGKPAGDFIDFTEAFSSLTPILKEKRGQGEFVIGQKTQDVVADLSAYSKLTIVATPGLKLVLYMNHEINPRENAGDYTEEEAGKYVFLEVQADENGIAEVDLTQYAKQDLNCICLPWDNSNKGTVWYLLLTENEDPLAFAKNELSKAIAQGEAVNAFGKTEESYSALASAIDDAKSALEDATSAEELEAAATAITDAISGLELADGYTTLTADMFKTWDSADAPSESSEAGCDYKLNESTGMPYGDSSVKWYHFADISEFNKLVILANAGIPRIMMNREVGEPDGGNYVELKDAPVDGLVEVDLTAYDYAHLNAIKGANWANVTVTDMLLYRTVTIADAGWASFGSLDKAAKLNDATVYAAKYVDGSVQLTTVDSQEVPAGVGVLVEGSGEIVPTFDVEAGSVDSDLKVSNGTVAGNGSIYVLANGSHDVGFYLLAEGVKIPAGKAYLEVNANGREFIGFGDATGIKNVETVKANGTVYNLAGQQVKNAQKGVFIVNGKKVIK